MLSDSFTASGFLLVVTVAVIGVLHTAVPDYWVPITLIARQRAWSQRETALAAAQAGLGHVVTTLIIGLVVWFAGVQCYRHHRQHCTRLIWRLDRLKLLATVTIERRTRP
jgi:hypothetical protein